MRALSRLSSFQGKVRHMSMSSKPSKVFASAEEACSDIAPGSSLLVGGFGLSGVPENLLSAIQKSGVDNLSVVSSNVGTSERGLGLLFQVSEPRGNLHRHRPIASRSRCAAPFRSIRS